MAIKFSNLASTTLASGVSDSATSISVTSASLFPTLGSGDYFYATIGIDSGSEIVKVTGVSGTTFTIQRAQDGTSAISHSSGDEVALRVTAASLNDLSTQGDTESVSISGDTMTGNLSLGDNVKAQFGAGSDLQIYHDSNNSYIVDSGYGNLYINANEFRAGNADNTKDFIHGNDGAEVKLFYNNAPKLATTSTGIDVTGSVVADGLTVDGGGNRSYFNLSHPRLSDGYKLEWGGGTNYIIGSNASNYVKIATNGSDALTISSSQNVNIPNGKIGVGFTTAPSNTLEVKSSGNDNGILLKGSGGNSIAWIHQQSTDAATLRLYDGSNLNVLIGSNANSDSYFNTGGNLGIGTSSPSATLDVENSSGAMVMVDDTNGRFIKIRSANSGSQNANISSYSGLYLGGSDNASHMLISNTGNVSIGSSLMVGSTTAPTTKFELNSGGANSVYQTFTRSTGGTNEKYWQMGIGTNHRFSIGRQVDANNSLSEYLSIASNGNATFSGSITANQNFTFANNNTDNTNKEGHLLARQYDSGTETEGFQVLQYFANSSLNRIDIGGASSQYNAATQITFNTAANTTTRTGTQALTLDSSQNATFSGDLSLTSGKILFGTSYNGTIGTASGDLFIGTADSNILFYNGSSVLPANSVGGIRDNAIDLGSTSARFKNAHLSVALYSPTIFGSSGATGVATLQSCSGNANHAKITVGDIVSSDNGGITFYTAGSSTATQALRLAGTSQAATFSGSVSTGSGGASGKIAITGATATGEQAHTTFTNTQGAKTYAIGGGQSGVTNNGFVIRNVTDNTFPLVISDAGASTFSGAVTIDGTTFLDGGNGYFRDSVGNSFSSGWNANSDDHSTWINFEGYQGGTTKFRDLRIGNGKQQAIAMFDGSSGHFNVYNSLMVGSTTAPSSLLHIKSTTTATATIEAGGGGDAVLDLKAPEASGAESIIRFSDSVSGVGFITYAQNDGGSNFMRFGTNSTERMRIDSSGNVGIGTSSAYSGAKLSVNGSIVQSNNGQHVIGTFGTSGLQLIGVEGGDSVIGTMGGSENLLFRTASQERARLTSGGILLLKKTSTSVNVAGGYIDGSEAIMSLADGGSTYLVRSTTSNTYTHYVNGDGSMYTAGNVGIGCTPVTLKSSTTLQVSGNAKLGDDNGRGLLSLGDINSTGANVGIWRGAAGAYAGVGNYLNLGGYDGITFTTGASEIASQTERMRIDSSGNVGIGVVPETWLSTVDVLQVGLGASFAGNTVNPSRTYLSANSYINSSNQESYIATDEASQYFQNAGTHLFKVAPSGSADSAISWTTAMTIDNSGNVGIGNAIASSFNSGANNLVIGSGSGSEGMTIYGGGESNIFFADGTAGSAAYVGRIEYSHSVDKMLFYVNNSQAITIDSSGSVGIGVVPSASHYKSLEIGNSGSSITGRGAADTHFMSGLFWDAASTYKYSVSSVAVGSYQITNGIHYWATAPAGTAGNTATPQTNMMLTAGGDLLVGTTDTNVFNNSSGSGIDLRASGEVQSAVDSGECLYLNRMGTDGRIISLRKAGAFVGGVGVVGGDDLYIAGGATGLRFDSGVGKIYPTSGSGTVNDNTVDIGETNYRFKDLYLSGGVYLGGTGAANKLDDYEEGTFTPTYTVAGGGTAGTVTGTNVGTYTKVGRVVNVAVTSHYVPTSGTVPTSYSMTLPFAVGVLGGQSGNGSGQEVAQTGVSVFVSVGNNATTAVIKATNGAAPPANAYFNFSFTYQTA